MGVPQNKTILNEILSFMRKEGIPAYDEDERKGGWSAMC